jgi:hypothetical protein
MEWIRAVALKEGMVSAKDLQLLHLTDSPAEVVQIISDSQGSLRRLENNGGDEYRSEGG